MYSVELHEAVNVASPSRVMEDLYAIFPVVSSQTLQTPNGPSLSFNRVVCSRCYVCPLPDVIPQCR